MNLEPSKLAEKLLPWFDAHGRHDLPWQADPTPYRVWVSEVMLQQTQVETVKPYFERFIARFPDVASLAAAPQDEVMRLWSGLGYYARARNLHRAAAEIVARHGSELPDSLDALMELPGIGRSTAGAILALARDQRHPILDGNVKRVLARVYLVEEAAESTAGLKKLWALLGGRNAGLTSRVLYAGDDGSWRDRLHAGQSGLRSLPARTGLRGIRRGAPIDAAGRAPPRAAAPEAHAHAVRAVRRPRAARATPAAGHLGRAVGAAGVCAGGRCRGQPGRALRARGADPAAGASPARLHAFRPRDRAVDRRAAGARGLAAEGEARWQELAAIEAVGLPAPVARLLEELQK